MEKQELSRATESEELLANIAEIDALFLGVVDSDMKASKKIEQLCDIADTIAPLPTLRNEGREIPEQEYYVSQSSAVTMREMADVLLMLATNPTVPAEQKALAEDYAQQLKKRVEMIVANSEEARRRTERMRQQYRSGIKDIVPEDAIQS